MGSISLREAPVLGVEGTGEKERGIASPNGLKGPI